jgi:hypothetical protein
MNKGEKWRCADLACQAEIVVTHASALACTEKVRCASGSMMKRQYAKPMLRKALGVGWQIKGHCLMVNFFGDRASRDNLARDP